uniref:Uncharacterized protein n=1 Tax=Esox lucius TaxID=8010 RepID=A0A3P8ZXS0_ESOLU
MPIWSVTCSQLWVEPSLFRLAANCSLILMMRSNPVYTYHILIFNWDSTLLASSASLHTRVKPPTRSPRPIFLASRSISPLAKP